MANETCPHCGSEAVSAHGWGCGTVLQFGGHVQRSWNCTDRQILRLTDQLAAVTAERDGLLARNRPVPNMKRQSTPTNCFRTCVAQVLGLEIDTVPSGCDGASWDWNQFQDWLAGRGLQAVEIGFANGGTLYEVRNPVPCIITGQSPRECKTGRHAVVGLFTGLDGFEINGDPHPSELWIDGEPTHAVFFVPINPRCVDELSDLQQRLDAAPVAMVAFSDDGEVGCISRRTVISTAGNNTVRRCRLVREPEPAAPRT